MTADLIPVMPQGSWDNSLPLYYVRLNISRDTRNYWFMVRRGRAAEAVMILRRLNGRYLVHTKGFYPPGSWRIMTGGIHPGEEPAVAALRETHEETGLSVHLVQALARINYAFVYDDETVAFSSFLYLLQEEGGELGAQDEDEDISGFREASLDEFEDLALQLESLQGDDWGDWGAFRAVAHRIARNLLQGCADVSG